MAFITIQYAENGREHPLEYKGVKLVSRKDKEYLFNSGNFVKDWYDAKKQFVDMASDELYLTHSSSVDHFIMDGGNDIVDSAWLVWDDDGDNARLVYEYTDKGWEIFVPKGTKPTWEELKASLGYGKQKQLN